jgi:hypothetical protein
MAFAIATAGRSRGGRGGGGFGRRGWIAQPAQHFGHHVANHCFIQGTHILFHHTLAL